MPQREALTLMSETDYVLMIAHDPLNVPGKFYDYIGSGKPILGSRPSRRAIRAACSRRCEPDGGRAITMSKASASSLSTPQPAATRCQQSFNPT